MKDYTIDRIRNVALIGHGQSGKTSLTEAILFVTGATERRRGCVEQRRHAGALALSWAQAGRRRGVGGQLGRADLGRLRRRRLGHFVRLHHLEIEDRRRGGRCQSGVERAPAAWVMGSVALAGRLAGVTRTLAPSHPPV